MGRRVVSFCKTFQHYFTTRYCDDAAHAHAYLQGLMQARRKNMERMAEVVPDSDEQSLQHFISNVDWDARALSAQIGREANDLLGRSDDTALLIDESGFEKKGKHSVGVSRQWNGRLGKVDNCQVGVFASLCHGRFTTLIDGRLYLPEEWANDRDRCRKAHIPTAHRTFKTKPQIALEMVRQARKNGLRYGWVGADGLYGNDPALLYGLDDLGETFMMDVHKDQFIYVNDPAPYIPEEKSRRARKPRQAKTLEKALRVDKWAEQQPEESWVKVTLREGDKGKLTVDILHGRVWYWDRKTCQAKPWHLVVRRESDSSDDLKYSVSNAPQETRLERLAHMQGQRFWVERAFQDGKSHCGLDHYQVRGWQGWHHPVALVMMAMLFMLKEKRMNQEEVPLLSCHDVEILLTQFLPKRGTTDSEVIAQMEKRHRKRQAAIDSQMKKQRMPSELS